MKISIAVFFATFFVGFMAMWAFQLLKVGSFFAGCLGIITAIAAVGAFVVWAIRERKYKER